MCRPNVPRSAAAGLTLGHGRLSIPEQDVTKKHGGKKDIAYRRRMRSDSLSSSPVALKPSLMPNPLLVTSSLASNSVSNSHAFLKAWVKGPALTLVAADSIDFSSCFTWLRVRVQNVRARQRATHLIKGYPG